jgi:hypothetical protein
LKRPSRIARLHYPPPCEHARSLEKTTKLDRIVNLSESHRVRYMDVELQLCLGRAVEVHILILRSDGWMRREQLDQTELTESFFEKFDKASADALLSFADTSLTDEEFETKLRDFVQNVTALRGELVNQMATSVLAQVLNDPNFKDPLKRLPHATRRKFGKTAARYFYDEEGRSGYGGLSVSTSPSASVSPSTSFSPSASASPHQARVNRPKKKYLRR